MDREPIKADMGSPYFEFIKPIAVAICFVKEIKWGKSKRYYLTDEPNTDLEPYILVRCYRSEFVIVDKDENVFRTSTNAMLWGWDQTQPRNSRRIPSMSCYCARNFTPIIKSSKTVHRYDTISVTKFEWGIGPHFNKRDLKLIRDAAKAYCRKL